MCNVARFVLKKDSRQAGMTELLSVLMLSFRLARNLFSKSPLTPLCQIGKYMIVVNEMSKKRILIVEDEAVTAMDLQTRLFQLGYDVPAMVTSGEEAIRIAAELQPDLVLMDITLDGQMNGIEAAEALWTSNYIPVVFLTAHDDILTIQNAQVSQPYGYITKPYSMGNLQSTIETALYKHETDVRLRDVSEALIRKNAELERLTYTVSHDLKSPLITFKTYLGYLKQDMVKADTERIRQDIGFMETAADKMELLLQGILELSRLGRVENPAVSVTFRELVDDALSSVAGQLTQAKADVHLDEAHCDLFGDRQRLAEIWQNLIDNAVKYMGEQKMPRIDIGADCNGSETIFFVRDNGMGIDPRHKDLVFGLFEKLDPKSEGSGLGLALVRRIVELYNGDIWLESEGVGKGCCFKFTLPGAVKK